mgnify:CR=1 FL=1
MLHPLQLFKTLSDETRLAIVMLLALAWLLTHDGCAHPIGNTIALAVYVASGVLLALPWAIEKLEPYLTESEDQQ